MFMMLNDIQLKAHVDVHDAECVQLTAHVKVHDVE